MQTAFLVAALLLMTGFALRARLAWLQGLYIPASILGGLVGLVLVQLTLQIATPNTGGHYRWRSDARNERGSCMVGTGDP